MAHDIGFYDRDTEENITYFFGYAQGIFYEAFNAQHCNAGVSGSNQGVTRTAIQVRQALVFIKTSRAYASYPDPGRIKETIDKLEAYLEQNPDARIFIHFS